MSVPDGPSFEDLPRRTDRLAQQLHPDNTSAPVAAGGGTPRGHPNPAIVYLARLAPGSRPTQKTALKTLAQMATNGARTAETCPWWELRYEHTAALRARLAERYSVATANRHLAALKGVLQEAWRMGLMDSETYHRVVDLTPIRGAVVPAGRSLSQDELEKLFDVCAQDRSAAGARDGVMFGFLYLCGMRRFEAAGLDVADIVGGQQLHVHGKGNKERLCPISDPMRDLLRRWFVCRTETPGPILCPVLKSGRVVVIRRMSAEAVALRLRVRGLEAGLQHFTAHDLRRSFVGDLLDLGTDLVTVQKLAGHAQVTMTAKYDRRGESAGRRAVNLLMPAWLKPMNTEVVPSPRSPLIRSPLPTPGTNTRPHPAAVVLAALEESK